MSETPLVSICCITYNHAPFIRQCLDGFVMQKTNFPIEVLIHDDASTDGTADIIREYEQKYPEIIKPIYQTENQYSKGLMISRTYNYPRVQGKYMALCEGDDYWIDEYKLQKQVDFLEANEDFSICFHHVNLFDETKGIFIDNYTVPEVPDVTDINTLIEKYNYINTLSVMYRVNKKVFEDIIKLPNFGIGDYPLHMLHAEYGKIKKLSEIMGVYRLHEGGSFSTKPVIEQYILWCKMLTGLIIHFSNKEEIYNQLINKYKDGIYSILINFQDEIANYDKDILYLKTFDNYISLKLEHESILNSRSWQITKPLRYISKLFKNIRYKLSINVIRKLKYISEYQNNIDFSNYNSIIKPIAFYLPQFHRIPENDKWWGDGFTEWTNTKKAKPRFLGHYQPREPHKDFGYYDLTNIETLKKQALLAKQHGIYGFCFYLYWFSGKKLLEKPLDLLLEHQEIDINFCVCWANENWTRRWDGLENEILIKQNYNDDDPYKFIENIKKYISDKRYIRKNGIPIILVYRFEDIPNYKDVFSKWKKHAHEIGIGEIKICLCKAFSRITDINIFDYLIDSEIEFPPLLYNVPIYSNNLFLHGKNAIICDYKDFVQYIKSSFKEIKNEQTIEFSTYYTCMLAWDNAARKNNNWVTFAGFSLKCFYDLVTLIKNDANDKNKEFIFINAWNEWGEGTYLEPDKKYGYANINTFSKALFGIPFEDYIQIKEKIE